jgi:hypothetical protein
MGELGQSHRRERRLPDYREPDRLVWVLESELKGGWSRLPVSALNFQEWRQHTTRAVAV